jgi:hypothetical protein
MDRRTINTEPPVHKQATILFHPTTELLDSGLGKITAVKSMDAFIEERYPQWQEEFWKFYSDQLGGIEAMMALPPYKYAMLGILFALKKEGKI